MKKYYIIVQFCIVIIAFALIGKNVIPTKVDIEYLEVVEIIGMDEIEDGVNVSVLLKQQQQSSGGSESGGSSSSASGKVLTVSSTTYSQAIDIVRTITEKYIIINHVKYYIVGEDTAKKSLENVVDYLARTDDTNVMSQILVAEEMTAEEFLNTANKSGMDVVKVLQEATLDVNAKNFTTDTTIIDLVDTFLQEKSVGVVPYVSVFSEDIQQFNIKLEDGQQGGQTSESGEQQQANTQEQKQPNIFGYMSVGIIDGMKVVDKISLKEVEAYNIVLGNVDNIVVLIRPSDSDKVVLTCDTEKYDVSFKTNGNNIEKMEINLKYECDLDEVQSTKELFTLERFDKFQQMAEEIIEKEVSEVISKSLESNLDFMELGAMFERKHPYVYLKIKDNFLEKLKKAKIEINVDCTINNTFDVMETNKFQKGAET